MRFSRSRCSWIFVWVWLWLVHCTLQPPVHAWEWSDLVNVGLNTQSNTPTLTMEEISNMRVRDIKWHLARKHGYGADELASMLVKKDLIESLAFEEENIS